MRRRRIGITGPARGGGAAWLAAATQVRAAGGVPCRISAAHTRPRPADLDGLILGGGSDVEPSRYGEPLERAPSEELRHKRQSLPLPVRVVRLPLWAAGYLAKRALGIGALAVDPVRDDLELTYLDHAYAHGLPVLGICRGLQLMNVFCGGNLHQDLRGFDLNPSRRHGLIPRERVLVSTTTRLHRLVGRTELVVNSLHNQAARELGRGLQVSATNRDGIVEALEHREHPFFIGVQWHPEYLPFLPEQRGLFLGLVAAAGTTSPTVLSRLKV